MSRLLFLVAFCVVTLAAAVPGSADPAVFARPSDAITPTARNCGAIRAALDIADGRPVWLSGRYICAAPLILPSHTLLTGDGTAVIRFTWATEATGAWAYVISTNTTNVQLRNLTIRGAYSGLPSGPIPPPHPPHPVVDGIYFADVSTFTLRRISVAYVQGIGIAYRGSGHGRIEENYVHDTGRDGITGFWGQGNRFQRVAVIDNIITRPGDDGIAVWGAGPLGIPGRSDSLPSNILIRGNHINGYTTNPNGLSLGHGIAVGAADDVEISDNTIAGGTYGSGILITGSTGKVRQRRGGPALRSAHVVVSGNSIAHAGALQAGSSIGLIGDGTGGYGVEFEHTDESIALANTVTDPLAYPAVFIGADCYRVSGLG